MKPEKKVRFGSRGKAVNYGQVRELQLKCKRVGPKKQRSERARTYDKLPRGGLQKTRLGAFHGPVPTRKRGCRYPTRNHNGRREPEPTEGAHRCPPRRHRNGSGTRTNAGRGDFRNTTFQNQKKTMQDGGERLTYPRFKPRKSTLT